MIVERDISPRQRLIDLLAHLRHVLPAQAPIRDFVHHNTLHGFQHLPFADALAAATQLTGASTYWPEARFRAAFEQGRINCDDLDAALNAAGLDQLDQPLVAQRSRRDILRASLLVPPEGLSTERRAWLSRETQPPEAAILALCRTLTAAPSTADVAWQNVASQRWATLCQRVGGDWTLRHLLEHLSGENILERVRSMLQRHVAAHLDLGIAAWRNPARADGFYAAWRASAGLDVVWELDDLPAVHEEIVHLPADPLDTLLDELPRLLPDEARWPAYLERLALDMPGWAGMFLWRDDHPATGDGTPVAMLDYLAVRVVLERLLADDLIRRLTGSPLNFDELAGYFAACPAEFFVRDALRCGNLPEDLQNRAAYLTAPAESIRLDESEWIALAEAIADSAQPDDSMAWYLAGLLLELDLGGADQAAPGAAEAAQLLDCAGSLSPMQRGQIWLEAYERHYREQLLTALAANHSRQQTVTRPSAQVIMCMDDREEGTRRHLEEIAPDVVTYGAAGFFGVAMYWQGLNDAAPTALCPVVVTPEHLVCEQPALGREAALAAHAARQGKRLGWRESLFQKTGGSVLVGPLLTALAGLPALLALCAASLSPNWFGRTLQRWREWFDGALPSRLVLTAETPASATGQKPQHGFTDEEQVDRVAAFLRMIGLTQDFAPLVLMFGHGSGSLNNPHLSAYDCGACSGRHGGPNARVFAAMANRREVRAGLAERGLTIPDSVWFVAAEHNTCDDSIVWYDLEAVPANWQPALDRLVGQLNEACRAHAAERCRRLASAPRNPTPWQGRQHVGGRAQDISQVRPELGHATNAAAFIGRRAMSRGLFLDRRVFLISYDPLNDPAGSIAEGILLAAGPVGAGIALEYYFSTVNNEYFGCGSKVTHNITGQFGVMEGADSDLRTGLPWQMVEIHEPMRLLVVVEQRTDVLAEILQRQPPLQELINNAWIVLVAKEPSTGAMAQYCPCRGWLPWSGSRVLPQVARSADWFAGQSEALAPAQLLGAMK